MLEMVTEISLQEFGGDKRNLKSNKIKVNHFSCSRDKIF
jgi:hypothetical protein